MSSLSARMPRNLIKSKFGYCGVGTIVLLVLVTLYLAFAFPINLLQNKHADTSDIKGVIVIGRSGEETPSSDAYFAPETEPESLQAFGYGQLTGAGRERMFALGKFLRMRYPQLLGMGANPRVVFARTPDSDQYLESAQTLLASLLPARDAWAWPGGQELGGWQPKAVHTSEERHDDLLSLALAGPTWCPAFEEAKQIWKNSTRYQELLAEFRHDMQTLRANTGLDFEDDLEMLVNLEETIEARKAFGPAASMPEWYTPTLAQRLEHIAYVSTESRFAMAPIQRLYSGRLLHEMVHLINSQIRIHKYSLASMDQQLLQQPASSPILSPSPDDPKLMVSPSVPSPSLVAQLRRKLDQPSSSSSSNSQTGGSADSLATGNLSSYRLSSKLAANVHVYLADKQRLSALLSALRVYSSLPKFGFMLLVELHYDHINSNYFLKLFTLNGDQPQMVPEPLRVNPVSCSGLMDECDPQQFEHNLQHLILNRDDFQEACNTPFQQEHNNNNNNNKPYPLPVPTTYPVIPGVTSPSPDLSSQTQQPAQPTPPEPLSTSTPTSAPSDTRTEVTRTPDSTPEHSEEAMAHTEPPSTQGGHPEPPEAIGSTTRGLEIVPNQTTIEPDAHNGSSNSTNTTTTTTTEASSPSKQANLI